MYLLYFFWVQEETRFYSEATPGIYYTATDFIISGLILIGCLYALYKLITPSDSTGDYKLMHCPECGKEPYKIWKWTGPGVTLSKRLLGYLNCIHCGTHLRRVHSKVLYSSVFTLTLSYLGVFSIPYFISFETNLDLIIWIFAVLGGLMLVSSLTALFYLVARTRFVRVDAVD